MSPRRLSERPLVLAWYLFRATFPRRVAGYITIVVLIGLVGGVAMAALAAARRTDSSYPRFLSTTNPSTFFVQPTTNGPADCGSQLFKALVALPHVKKVECATGLDAETLDHADKVGTILLTQVELVASTDGDFDDIDRVTITAGHRPDPDILTQVVASPEAATLLHLTVGSALRVGITTATQTVPLPPYRTLVLHVVGLGTFNHQVVQDDIDRDHTGILLGSPALARRFTACCTEVPYDAIQVAGGARNAALVDGEYAALVRRVAPHNPQLLVYDSSTNETAAQRSIRPQAIALGVFGVIVGLATLLVAALAIFRQEQSGEHEGEILRALGASPADALVDGALGIVASVVVGALLAAIVALCLSPLTDFGPVAAVDPARGFNADWTVLGFGVLALVVLLGAVAILGAGRDASTHGGGRPGAVHSRSRLARPVAGLPPAAQIGVRFALEPGQGRTSAPIRSTIIGAVLAVAVVTATVTFGSSLGTLISHPSIYGWNFDDALFSTSGFGPLPTSVFGPLLAKDHQIASTTNVWFADLLIDGMTVPTLVEPVHSAIAPLPLSGESLASRGDIVLGPATLAALHRHVGDTVTVSGNGLATHHLRIVGTAGFPSIGPTFATHASMSVGALVASQAVPAAVLAEGIPAPFAGPNATFVRFARGVTEAEGTRSLQRVVAAFERVANSPAIKAASGGQSALITVETLPVQRPAEIVNYRSMGTTPGILASALALGTIVALVLTLVATVRRRRRDLAVLKTIGFTSRQLLLSVIWQAMTIATIGVFLGVPIGIATGRWLWTLFAEQLAVVVEPAVPAPLLIVIALGALILAGLVSAPPGRIAARTPAALVLRSE